MRSRSKIVFPPPKDGHGQPLGFSRYNLENNISKAIDQLAGICKGILADGIVADEEALFFMNWVKTHADLEPVWPWTDILSRLNEVYVDGTISEEEREDLKAIMHEIIGFDSNEDDLEERSTALPLDNPQPPVIFPNSTFCITGRFAYGTRAKVFEAISSRGGIVINTAPTKGVRFLIIGTFASRDWYYTNYGRKIERAIELRSEGTGLAIISEEHWRRHLS